MSRFNITVSSRFEELWRYNIVVVYELCSSDGERIEYKSQESFVAPVGSNLKTPPADYDSKRTIKMASKDGNYINLLIYVVPNTLPSTDEIARTKPFHLAVKVESDKNIILNQVFEINQWSGDNISLEKLGLEM